MPRSLGQLALNVRLRDASSFENFQVGRNGEAVARLQTFARHAPEVTPPVFGIYLWGERGSGKTHLIEAVCRVSLFPSQEPVVLPLAERGALAPELLNELDIEKGTLVCVDDMQAVAGERAWEAALLGLYERLRAQGGRLLVTGASSPARLGLQLPDLATRLTALLVYPLQGLDDDEKLFTLRQRAQRRGLDMGDEVARYLLQRFPRDLHSLFVLLDKLDSATLAAQRRLTIPFVREFVEHTGSQTPNQ